MKYIDIHGHVNFPQFDVDREETIKRAHDAEVAMITVGTDLATSKSAVELAEKTTDMWVIVGLHPADDHEAIKAFDAVQFQKDFSALAAHPKVVAIGECGLDYFRTPVKEILETRERQTAIFIEHIKMANTLGKPLMLHVRNPKDFGKDPAAPSAYQEALKILKEHAKVPFNFHFFAGTLDDLKDILDAGGYVSFTGVITFTPDYNDLIRYAPLEKIMTETDCPFVAPLFYRGKRNEPSYVTYTVKAIAAIRNQSEPEVQAQLVENARSFFNI